MDCRHGACVCEDVRVWQLAIAACELDEPVPSFQPEKPQMAQLRRPLVRML